MRQIISFPKSGRSWVRYALHTLGVERDIRFHHDGFEYNDATRPPLDFDLAARRARYEGQGPIVYLSRDPRDLMVSFYHQITGRFADLFGYEVELQEFLRDPYFGAAQLLRFQAQWAGLCNEGIALHVRYEALHEDFAREFGRLARALGYGFSDAELAVAASAANIENMRAVEVSGEFSGKWLRLRNNSPKVRRGRVGAHVGVLSPSDLQWLEDLVQALGNDDGGGPARR
ncbi:MAG TPA: sulfotransferase domain-containing protein [Caulobacteraceae bacterium]